MVTVRNMTSSRTDREVANQFVIEDAENNKTIFQSYRSPIVEIDRKNGIITFYPHWNYSNTTAKYRNKFLQEEHLNGLNSAKAIQAAIDKGEHGIWKVIEVDY